MITINLLPKEMRKRERTPLVLLLPLLGGLICVLSAGSLAAYVHFVWLAEVTNTRMVKEQELAQKGPQLSYETKLLAEEAEFKKRVSTIEQIAAGRILMTKKIDELTEIAVAGDDNAAEGYLVWVQEMKFTPPAASRGRKVRGKPGAKSGGQIKMSGFVLSDDDPLQAFNRAHEALKNSEMFALGYNDLTDPMGSLEVFKDVEPKKGWTMDMVMDLKDPAESKKLREKIEQQMAAKEDRKPKNNRRGK